MLKISAQSRIREVDDWLLIDELAESLQAMQLLSNVELAKPTVLLGLFLRHRLDLRGWKWSRQLEQLATSLGDSIEAEVQCEEVEDL